jgi:hypothetical protein
MTHITILYVFILFLRACLHFPSFLFSYSNSIIFAELQNSKKLMEGRILGGKPVGRPHRWWIDAVYQDTREQLGVRRWMREAEDRKGWRRLIEQAMVHFGLYCHRRERERIPTSLHKR